MKMTNEERAAWREYLEKEKSDLLHQVKLSSYLSSHDSDYTFSFASEVILCVIELINEQMPGFLCVPAKYLEVKDGD